MPQLTMFVQRIVVLLSQNVNTRYYYSSITHRAFPADPLDFLPGGRRASPELCSKGFGFGAARVPNVGLAGVGNRLRATFGEGWAYP